MFIAFLEGRFETCAYGAINVLFETLVRNEEFYSLQFNVGEC
jgi:hypothetical protein